MRKDTSIRRSLSRPLIGKGLRGDYRGVIRDRIFYYRRKKYAAFAESWQEGDLASLVLEDKAAERMLLFDSQMRLAGWTNTATGEVRSPFPGLDPSQCRAFSFCGIHLVSEEIFALMEGWPCRFGIIDFYLSVCRKRTIRGYVPGGLRVFDIGTPESLEEAQKAYSSTR